MSIGALVYMFNAIAPIHDILTACMIIFAANFFTGLFAGVLVQHEGFIFRKAFKCISEAAVISGLMAMILLVGDNIDNQQLKDYASQKSNTLMNFFKSKITRKPHTADDDIHKPVLSANYDMLVFGPEHDKLDYKLSTCCNPIPGDEVFGFVTINEGIKVHKKDCPNAISLQSNYAYRIIQAKWIDSSQQEFKAILNIHGMDSLGLTNELTKVISNNMHVNIQSISLSGEAGIFNGQVTVVVQNNTILKKLIDNIKKIDGIDKVTRVYKN